VLALFNSEGEKEGEEVRTSRRKGQDSARMRKKWVPRLRRFSLVGGGGGGVGRFE